LSREQIQRQVKRTLLVIGAIGVVCALGVVRMFFKQENSMTQEREWFVKGLRYEFSARVDSIAMYNEHAGLLSCRVTAGDPKTYREDSLKRSFKMHDMLYLIFRHSGDSITFIVPDAKDLEKGDSVRVSSANNSIEFFREGTLVTSDKLSKTLTGFGRPFFLKRK
jgi:hypothetical protein